ncbi:MAG: hypothetical protein NWS56_09750, partial [Haliea sp.]|nr:hypothetical protein [Haliea sp.]
MDMCAGKACRVGANNKKAAKDDSEADKEAEKLRKKAEMAALLAEEDAANGGVSPRTMIAYGNGRSETPPFASHPLSTF